MNLATVTIRVRVSTGSSGWRLFEFEAPESAVEACYALPRHASRASFWWGVSGLEIPDGNALIWEPVRS